MGNRTLMTSLLCLIWHDRVMHIIWTRVSTDPEYDKAELFAKDSF